MVDRVTKTDEEWKNRLTPEQYGYVEERGQKSIKESYE
jgi:hypothetical protein